MSKLEFVTGRELEKFASGGLGCGKVGLLLEIQNRCSASKRWHGNSFSVSGARSNGFMR